MKLFLKRNSLIVSSMIFIAIVLVSNIFQKEVRGYFYSISLPVQTAFLEAGSKLSDFLLYFSNAKILEKENRMLNLRIRELLAEISSLKRLKEENLSLRQALNLGLEEEFQLYLVRVVGRDLGRDAVLINKGSLDGLETDQKVITAEKVLVGRVGEVFRNNAKIILLSDKNSVIEVEVSGKDISGLLRGKGNFKAVLDLVPKDKVLKEGDVLTDGEFLVGIVEKPIKNPLEPFQKAEVSLFLGPEDLRILFIAKQ